MIRAILSREYDGWEMLYDRKMIVIKIVRKKEIKKPKIINERKVEKSEKEKIQAKWKRSEKCIKDICQSKYIY